MKTNTPFTPIQAQNLCRFLAAPERPAGTFSYPELSGFLFALCSAPEMVPPSDWLPLIFSDQEAGYKNFEESQQILSTIMTLYNHINQGVQDKQPALPPQCEARREVMSNLDPSAPLSLWARGIGVGHDYLSELWDAHTPKEMQQDLDSCMMVLTFFASRPLAEAYHQELQATDRTLDEFAAQMLELLPEALHQYTLLGLSIATVLQKQLGSESN